MRPAFYLQILTIVVSGVALAERSLLGLFGALVVLWACNITLNVESRRARQQLAATRLNHED